MRRWILTVFVWSLISITLISGLNLTQVTGLTSSSTSVTAAEQLVQTSTLPTDPVPNGYHLATEADIQQMKEQLIVPENVAAACAC